MPVSESNAGEKQQQLDREIRDMISALTRRLTDLQKKPTEAGGSSIVHDHDEENDDHGGVRIITMAGSNLGATMRGEMSLDDHKPAAEGSSFEEDDQQLLPPPLTTYLNSNFQAVNNSIMIGGSYSTNDPGIHLDVDDHYEEQELRGRGAPHRHGKKGKKKDSSELSKGNHHSI